MAKVTQEEIAQVVEKGRRAQESYQTGKYLIQAAHYAQGDWFDLPGQAYASENEAKRGFRSPSPEDEWPRIPGLQFRMVKVCGEVFINGEPTENPEAPTRKRSGK